MAQEDILTGSPLGEFSFVEDEEILFQDQEENIDEEEEEQEDGSGSEFEEEEEVVDETPKDDTEDDIPFSAFVESWKDKKLLSKDFTLPDNVTVDDFRDLVYKDIYEPLKNSAESDIESYSETLKEKRGLSDKILGIATAIAQGISPQTLQDGQIIETILDWDIESDTDEAFENREKLISAMYKHKGLDEKKTKRLLETLQDNDEDLDEAKEAKKFFKTLKEEKEQSDIKAAKSEEDRREKEINAFHTSLKTMIDKGEVMGGDKKGEFFDDLITPSIWEEFPTNDGKKVKRKITKWQQKQMELGISISPTSADDGEKLKNFLTVAHSILYKGAGAKAVEEQAKKKVEDSLSSFLKGSKPKQKSNSEFLGAIDEDNLIL